MFFWICFIFCALFLFVQVLNIYRVLFTGCLILLFKTCDLFDKIVSSLQVNSNGGRYLDNRERWLDSKSVVYLQRIMWRCFGMPCWASTSCRILHSRQRNNHRSMIVSARPILKITIEKKQWFRKQTWRIQGSALLMFFSCRFGWWVTPVLGKWWR